MTRPHAVKLQVKNLATGLNSQPYDKSTRNHGITIIKIQNYIYIDFGSDTTLLFYYNNIPT